jgi:two-component system cell cycle response regulator DivK
MTKILVVDDNAASRELLRTALKGAGRLILEASQGCQALQMVANEAPDLVLLDIEMPVLDGFAVLRELRQDPRFASLPVVAVTANAMQGAREKALNAGFTGYITKPIRVAEVRTEVARLLPADEERK